MVTVPTKAPAAVVLAVLCSGASLAHGMTGGAVITGRVLVKGTPPAPIKAKVRADPHCQAQHPDGLELSEFAVSNGGLAEVLVYLKTGVKGTFAAPVTPALLDQKGCRYFPPMLAVQAGQPVKVRNSDPTLHNVHFRPRLNSEINIGQPRVGMESTRTFGKPEVMVPIGCDVHPWMRAHMAVLSHPFFAVSGEGGRFEIRGVPPGRYEVEARHPKLEAASATVDVTAGATTVDLTLSMAP
jgi:hypothetical protein